MRRIDIVRLYRRRLRARLAQEAFAFAGVAVGVALLFAVQVSNTSLSHAIADLTRGFVGRAQLQLMARGSSGLDERIATVVARDADVRAVAPLLEAPANVVGPRGARGVTMLAADGRVAALGGSLPAALGAGVSLAALRAVALPATVARAVGVRAGGRVRLQVAGRTTRVPVAATLDSASVGTLAAAPVVLAPLAYAQRLAGSVGRVSRLYVSARPGREAAVRRLLSGLAGDALDVRPATSDEQVFRQAAAPNDQSSALFAQVSALVGFLFALNAMLLMAGDRRRLIAKLRFAGHEPRVVRWLLALDALVLGVAGSVAGLALGELLSRFVLRPAPGYLTLGFPVGAARTVDASAVLTALLAGMLAAAVGTVAPLLATASWARRSRARDPLGAQEGSDVRRLLTAQPRWAAAGALALAGALAVWRLAPTAATAGIILLVVACVLALPAALSGMLRGVARLARSARSPVAALAIGELRANGSRSLILAAVAAIAVFASGAIDGARSDLQAGLDTVTHAVNVIADVWVTPASSSNQLGVDTFPASARRGLAHLPRIARVDLYRGELLRIDTRLMWVFAPASDSRELIPANQILAGNVAVAERAVRAGAGASVSRAFAEQHHLHVGSTYLLPAPRPQRVRVAAITTNIGWPPGAIVVSSRTFTAGWGSRRASALQVRLDPGTTPVQGRDLIARRLASTRWTGFTVETAAQRERHQRQASRDGLVRLQQISILVLFTAAVAVAIAAGAMILERRRGLAALKLRGVARRQIRIALMLEVALLLGTGCLTGAVVSLLGTQLLDSWLTTLTGFPVVRSSGAVSSVLCMLVVLIGAMGLLAWPIRRAADAPERLAFDA